MSDTNPGTALDKVITTGPPAPVEVGQATAIEQSRAFAEVQAAVYMAHQFPRDEVEKRQKILDACNNLTLAERAFFSFPRAGSRITGPSIHFARELARIWGNIQYGITELSRDDQRGSSQMIAYAWDLQTNARPSTTFITPHGRMAGGKKQDLTDPRDIYENNANQGARRVREMILAVLPRWLVEEAKATCMATMQHGGGKPLAVRIEDLVTGYGRAKPPITLAQLEHRVGMKRADWGPQEVATLGIVWTSLANGETTRLEEFPPLSAPVTAEEVRRRAESAAETPQADSAQPPQAADPSEPAGPTPQELIDAIYGVGANLGWTEPDIADDFALKHDGALLQDAPADVLAEHLEQMRRTS